MILHASLLLGAIEELRAIEEEMLALGGLSRSGFGELESNGDF